MKKLLLLMGSLAIILNNPALASSHSENSAFYLNGFIGYGMGHDETLDRQPEGSLLGLGAGIKINDNFSFETHYQRFQTLNIDLNTHELSVDKHLVSLGVIYKKPVHGNFSLFAKTGSTYYMAEKELTDSKIKDKGFSPFLGIGAEYIMSKKTSASLSYQYINGIGDKDFGEYDSHSALLSFSYHFGTYRTQNKNPKTTGQSILKCTPMHRNIYFAFGSHAVSDAEKESIHAFVKKIRSQSPGAGTISYELVGYANPIGPRDYNRDLSDKRLDAVESILMDLDVKVSKRTPVGVDDSFWLSNEEKRRVEILVLAAGKCNQPEGF